MHAPWKQAVAAVAVTLLAACGSGGTAAPGEDLRLIEDAEVLGGPENARQLQELYEQAVGAGQQTVDVYGVTTKSWAPLYEAFSERFPGIEVNSVTIFGPELVTRIDTEFATGRHVADMVSIGKADAIPLLDKGQLEPYQPFTTAGPPAEWVGPAESLYAPSTYIYAISYNGDEVSPQEAPKSFDDLLDPKWRGRIGVVDPTTIYGSRWLGGARERGVLDDGWLKAFGAQEPVVLPNENELFTAVATGRVAVAFPNWVRSDEVLRGQPVEFVVPMENGNEVAAFWRGIVANAPDDLAAKLLENWCFTPEAQALLPASNQQGLMPGAPGIPGLPPFEELELVSEPGWEEYLRVQDESITWLESTF